MPFDPDAFLAEDQAAQAPAQDNGGIPAGGIPAQVPPPQQAFDPDAYLAQENQAQYGTPEQQAATFGEAVARGAVSQPIASAAEVAGGVPAQNILGREKANPWTSFFGELTGFGLGAFSGLGEAAWLARIPEIASAGKIGAPVIKALIEGETLIAGDEGSKAILQDPDQTAGSVAAHLGLGAIISGSLGAVSGLWSAARSDKVTNMLDLVKHDSQGVGASLAPQPGDLRINPFMRRALNVALGPTPEVIDARVANLEAIRTAPEFQDVYDHVLNHLNDVGDDVAAQKQILVDAQRAFESSGYDAKLASQSAKAALKDAQTQIIQDVTRDAFSKAPAIANAIDVVNTQAINDSQTARDILNSTNKQISLNPFYEKIKELQDKVFSEGSPLALRQAEELGKYADTVGLQYGTKIDAPMAKNILSGLDTYSKWNAGQLENSMAPYYRQMRYTLDQSLKDAVPEYAQAIAPAADKFKFLDNLTKYSTTEDAVKAINTLKNKANFINEMPLLRDLENRSGIKFTQDLDQYASPAMQELRISKLPEYANAEKTAKAMAYYAHPETYLALEHTIMNDPEWLAAMQAKEQLKGLTEVNLQGKMNAVMGGKNISARTLMNKLPGLQGMSIPDILDLIAVRQAFDKGAGMGSRNVNLGLGLGTTIGGLAGGALAGPIGAGIGGATFGAVGAGVGAIVDKQGPAIAANMLDKYVDSFGSLPEATGLSERMIKRGLRIVLGTEAATKAEGFKAATDYADAAAKGLKDTKHAAKAVFTKGVSVLPPTLIPEKDKIFHLDQKLKEVQKKPLQHFAFGGEVGHYLPRHGEALSKIGANAVNILNAARPQVPHLAPLDEPMEPSTAAKENYHHILTAAEQPLTLMKHLKEGTLLPQHIATVKALYPRFYDHMNQELTNAMLDHISNGNVVPYHIRQGLTQMLGQPMDSTMTPMSAQSIIHSAGPQQMAQQQAKAKEKKASGAELSQINKVNQLSYTPLQAREAAKRD